MGSVIPAGLRHSREGGNPFFVLLDVPPLSIEQRITYRPVPLYGMLIDGSMAWSAATVNRVSRCRGLSLQFLVYLLAVSNVYDDRTVFAFNSKHGTIWTRSCSVERA